MVISPGACGAGVHITNEEVLITMIKVSHLTRRYGAFTAVDDVSFSIAGGEIVGLLGHNGAGKTTIMKMLTGYLEPTDGTILFDRVPIEEDREQVQRRIGYLPENCPVWPEMTVIDYLQFHARLYNLADPARAIAVAIRRTELSEKATMPIETLSRGYRQRVGVAQAILHDPDVVILDEPTNGLDPTQILHMRELIKELAKTATVIVSTHILQEVQAVCDRVLIMRSGKLVVDANLDSLQKERRIVVTVDRDVAAALEAVAGVDTCELTNTEADRRTYSLNADPSVAPKVAEALAATDARLYALYPEHQSLETLFARVNADAVKEELHV